MKEKVLFELSDVEKSLTTGGSFSECLSYCYDWNYGCKRIDWADDIGLCINYCNKYYFRFCDCR